MEKGPDYSQLHVALRRYRMVKAQHIDKLVNDEDNSMAMAVERAEAELFQECFKLWGPALGGR